MMRTTKAKIAASFMLAAVLAAGAGSLAHRTRAADPEGAKVQATIPAAPRRDPSSRESRIRFLSLAEARAIALENGSINLSGQPFPGIGLDNMIPPIRMLAGNGLDSMIPPLRVLADVKPKAEGIVLAGISKDVPRAEYERNANQILLNVEVAYWNLYGSYWNLHTREQGLRLAYETWKIVGAKYKVGRVSRFDFELAEGQYNLFRNQRVQAIETTHDNEKQLRTVLGMKTEDGKQLVPCDAPSLVEKKPDWEKALKETMKNRPELRMARQDVIARAKEKAPERDRARLVLQDQELKAERFLGLWLRRMSSAYFQIKAAKAQRLAFAEQLRRRLDGYRNGKKNATLDLVLEAQRFWADALAAEYQAIATYNNALCGWEYAKGSILDYARVALAEKAPADGEEMRAVEYERKQTRKKVSRAKAAKSDLFLPSAQADEDNPRETPAVAPSLPSLWKGRAPLPKKR